MRFKKCSRAKSARLLLSVLAVFLLATACGDEDEGSDTTDAANTPTSSPSDDAADDGTQQATFVADEFQFEIPELQAGPAEITLENVGEQPHFLFLVPVAEGAPPLDELLKMSEKESNEFLAGKPTEFPVVEPGDPPSKAITVDLKAGTYAALCFIDDPKTKKPHAFLGMAQEFEVE